MAVQVARNAAVAWETVWAGIETVMRYERVRPTCKLLFIRLWVLSGGRAGNIVVSTKGLAGDFGVDPRSARDWLTGLQQAKWIDIRAREKNGSMHLWIEDPQTLDRPRRFAGDPQQPLPLPEDPEPIDAGDDDPSILPACGAFGGERGAEVFVQIPPRPRQEAPRQCPYRDPPCALSSPPSPSHRQEGGGKENCAEGFAQIAPRLHENHDDGARTRQADPRDFGAEEWGQVRRRAAEWGRRLWPPNARTSATSAQWIFLLRLAVLIQAGRPEEWVEVGIDETTKKRREDRIDYLKGVLRNRLVSMFGVAKEDKALELDRLVESVRLPEAIVAAGPPRPPQRSLLPASREEQLPPLSQATATDRSQARAVLAAAKVALSKSEAGL